MKKLFILLAIIGLSHSGFLSDELYEEIKNNKYYKAVKPSESVFAGFTDEQLESTISFRELPKENPFAPKEEKYFFLEKYDVRENYPNCEVYIKQQGKCGSSPIFATVSSVSYRYCMMTGENVELSAQEILSCKSDFENCRSGFLDTAFYYLEDRGVFTEECFPFVSGNKTVYPACRNECISKDIKPIKYSTMGGSTWALTSLNRIKQEIYANGPVLVGIVLYDSLYLYKEGVYVQGGNKIGGHALTAFGWGIDEETGKEYLLCQNSWGKDWGMDGFVKFDVESCKISQFGLSAIPRTHH